jgi:Cu2+-containing amine oxidase
MKSQRHITKPFGPASRGLYLLVVLLALGLIPSLLCAQAPLDPLTSTEIEQAKKTVLGDARMRQAIGISSSYRIVNIERHEEDKGIAAVGARRADVIMYNYATDETITCVVNLGSNPQVDTIIITRDVPSALSPEEVDEAKRLALADPIVRARLGSAGIAERSLIITFLLARDAPCSTHRCLMLFFNTQDAALDITVVVDLRAQRVFPQ